MRTPVFLATAFLLLVFGLNAQSVSFNTGDKKLDSYLNEINVEANADLTLFRKSLEAEFSISYNKYQELSKIMKPAEIYLSLRIAVIIGKPVDVVVTTYKAHKGKGWGVIAKELGIKPGSAEFHKLKNSVKGKSAVGNPGNPGKKGNSGKPKENGKSNAGGKGKPKK